MTDPLTLLDARRPYVRDTLPGERAAARAVLEAAIQAERPAPVEAPAPAPAPVPTRAPRRRIAALVGTAAAAAAVGVGTLLWPSATPVALGWDATPTVMADAAAARVDARCRSTADMPSDPSEPGVFVPEGAALVHVDQRGTMALATYVSDRSDHLWHVACLMWTETGAWDDIAHQPMSLGGASYPADPADPGTEQLFPGPLVNARRLQYEDMTSVEGRVEASVAEVVVVHDGQRLATRLTDGFFTAFWPEPWGNHEALDVSVELQDASGQVLRTYDLPV